MEEDGRINNWCHSTSNLLQKNSCSVGSEYFHFIFVKCVNIVHLLYTFSAWLKYVYWFPFLRISRLMTFARCLDELQKRHLPQCKTLFFVGITSDIWMSTKYTWTEFLSFVWFTFILTMITVLKHFIMLKMNRSWIVDIWEAWSLSTPKDNLFCTVSKT